MSKVKEKKKRQKVKSLDPSALPELPDGWSWVTLNDLAAQEPNSITDGPFGSNLKTSHYTDEGPRVLRLQNIGDGEFVDAMAHISSEHFESLAKHHIFGGDVLIAALGETLPRSCVVPNWVGPALVKADCPRFKPNPELTMSSYVNFALNSPDTRKRTATIIHGVGRPRLNLGEMRGTWIPVAPLPEQKRIVSKIEELFSDLDAGVSALERARANLRRYRASVLKSAVEGRLTQKWRSANPDVEPASELLARILRERRQRWEQQQLATYESKGKKPKNWQSKYKEPAAPDTANLPQLPNGWCWATVDQLTYYLRNGLSKKPSQTPPGHRILRINAVRPMSLDQNEFRYYEHDSVDNYFIEKGDLLFTRYNGSLELLGVCALVPELERPTLHPDKLIRLKTVLGSPLPAYIEIAANVGLSRKHMTGRARTTAGQTGISGDDVKEMPIPLCPTIEQTRIVELAAQQLEAAVRADDLLIANESRSSRLRQSILKSAFEGSLTTACLNGEISG